MLKKTRKNEERLRRHKRVRRVVSGTPDCPRLNVFRSNKQIYAQIIDDTTGRTLAASSSVVLKLENGGNVEAAKKVLKNAKHSISNPSGLTAAAMSITEESRRWLMQPAKQD